VALSNSEKEQVWIDGWSDLYDRIGSDSSIVILNSEYEPLSIEAAKGRIQDEAYQSRKVSFGPCYFKGKPALTMGFFAVD